MKYSPPIRHCKRMYTQFLLFLSQIKTGKETVIIGNDYVIMSHDHYKTRRTTMSQVIIARDKAALGSAVKKASMDHVTEITLQGTSLRIILDPVSARAEYNNGLRTPFEIRYTTKLQRIAKQIRRMDTDVFRILI